MTKKENGLTPLMIAAKENKLVIVERLLDLGVNVNDRANDGRTAIHYAAAYAKDDVVRTLLNRKADITLTGGSKDELPLHVACARNNGAMTVVQQLLRAQIKDQRLVMDKSGAIPLFLAAEVGNVSVCRELLTSTVEAQLSAQRKDNGDGALHIACRRRDMELARLLVESGAIVDMQNHEGQTALHIAAFEGDEPMLKYLLLNKASPYMSDKLDRSPVHIAAERGHTHIVDQLLDKFKSSLSARTKDGNTLMHIASTFGHPETALAFLKKGVPLYMPNKSGALCLHAAAMKGHTSVVKALLMKGTPVDSRTREGYTALHLATEFCKPQSVQLLLGYGAQVEAKGGKALETPLHIAARTKEGEKCAEMLLKSGADVNATKQNGETALHVAARSGQLHVLADLLEDGADPTAFSQAGETPLHMAVRHCHLEVAREILQHVSNRKSKIDAFMLVNQPNYEGETPVHYAAGLQKALAHDEFEDTDIMRLLLEYNGDVNIHTKMTYETALHYAARSGNDDVMLEMVKHIGSKNIQNAVNRQAKNGWSPLLVASEQGHLEVVKILLNHHARVDVFDEAHGKAALHLAAESGHDKVADILLWRKAYVNAKSKSGITPLHLAAQNGYNTLVTLLIETHKATIDALSLTQKTPLHMAAQHGQLDVCSTLLKLKADANAVDEHVQTPLHLAAENDHSDVVKLFLKHRPELVTMANTNGMTIAHIAAAKGSVGVLKELMKFNKAVVTSARNRTNESTALHLAAEGGYKEVVETLIEAGANPKDENGDGMTALHLAAKMGHVQILEALNGKLSFRTSSRKTGLTALHVAASYGQSDFIREMLITVPATIRSEPPGSGNTNIKDLHSEHGLAPLHLASKFGHEGLVRLLLNCPGVQAEAVTYQQGSTSLHLAAQSGHVHVVSLLLSKSTAMMHVKDKRGRTAIMLAAASGHLDMVTLLVGQGADINAADKNGWASLHFAAKAGHLGVVKYLVESGASTKGEAKDGRIPICFAAQFNHFDVLSYLMQKDHSTQKLMDDKKFVYDLMSCGKQNGNKCIEEFIVRSAAPVDTAAKLSNNFRILSVKEKERSKDLATAGDFCENMATDLLSTAASTNSPSVLLKAIDCNGSQFLDVLIEYEQKQVVAHPAVQKYLSDIWMGNLKWAAWKFIVLFCACFFIPIIWLVLSLPLKHRFNKVPIIKFMSYLVSHLYLMILFCVTTVYPLVPIWMSASLIPHWYEWLLLAWLSGLLVSELTNPGDRAGLGYLKVVILAICAIAIVCHILGFAFQGDDRLVMIFIRNLFFAIALFLCFVQMLDFLTFHHLFGPWAIIIRDLLKDLTRFLVVLLIFMVGFTLHLTAIYQPVFAPPAPDPVLGDGLGAGVSTPTISPLDVFELLLFSLFGLVDPESLPTLYRSPIWVVTIVKIVFGIYMMVTLIVLINLLIAMMSDTYQRIQQQSDIEWKFGRAKLIRNMNKTSATPAPLNLFTKLFTYIRVIFKHRGKLCSTQVQAYMQEDDDLDAASDTKSVDILANSSSVWLRSIRRRGGRHQTSHGPQRLEDAIDWKSVVKRYYKMQRGGEDFSDDEDEEKTDLPHGESKNNLHAGNGIN
ncbi:ankyrin-3-like [Dreissena polymorpha]|uniref:ankyrin-3-like n=1 Tax=Dreissena polymorpha TaxID=45954 RepID=UPI002264EBF1|nr:ankyrin-3-like [Dreissena polymorpha]